MACSTCHVIVDDVNFDKLEPPCDEEEDMLDLAYGLTPTSRLGCQIILSKDIEGITVTLPKATRNFYVDGHVSSVTANSDITIDRLYLYLILSIIFSCHITSYLIGSQASLRRRTSTSLGKGRRLAPPPPLCKYLKLCAYKPMCICCLHRVYM
jgi:hypothetical protein